jgi:hypothetical protein
MTRAAILAALGALLAGLAGCKTPDSPPGDSYPYNGPLRLNNGQEVAPPSWTNNPAGSVTNEPCPACGGRNP